MSPLRTRRRTAVACEVVREYTLDRGWLGLPKLFAKACLLVWRRPAHRRWLGVVGGATTRRLLEVQPRTAYRHASRYLFAGLPWKDRIALMSSHYAFLNREHDAAFFEHVIAPDGLLLWRYRDEDDDVAIVLLGPPHHREGDLRLHLKLNGTTLFKIAFSLVPGRFFLGEATSDDQVVYIGQVQGAAGELDAIRRATRRCMDIAPPDLLMQALAGLGEAWRVGHFLSPGPMIHASAEKLSRVAHPFDYGSFWARYQAVLLPSGHFVIEVPFPQKPIAQVVTRHRKRTLAKRDFKRALRSAVAALMTARQAAIRSSADSATPSAIRRS